MVTVQKFKTLVNCELTMNRLLAVFWGAVIGTSESKMGVSYTLCTKFTLQNLLNL